MQSCNPSPRDGSASKKSLLCTAHLLLAPKDTCLPSDHDMMVDETPTNTIAGVTSPPLSVNAPNNDIDMLHIPNPSNPSNNPYTNPPKPFSFPLPSPQTTHTALAAQIEQVLSSLASTRDGTQDLRSQKILQDDPDLPTPSLLQRCNSGRRVKLAHELSHSSLAAKSNLRPKVSAPKRTNDARALIEPTTAAADAEPPSCSTTS